MKFKDVELLPGVSSLIYADVFMDEKLPSFIEGTVNAVQFYGAVAKYFVPDNLRTAITKHSRIKDQKIMNHFQQSFLIKPLGNTSIQFVRNACIRFFPS